MDSPLSECFKYSQAARTNGDVTQNKCSYTHSALISSHKHTRPNSRPLRQYLPFSCFDLFCLFYNVSHVIQKCLTFSKSYVYRSRTETLQNQYLFIRLVYFGNPALRGSLQMLQGLYAHKVLLHRDPTILRRRNKTPYFANYDCLR